MVVIVMSANPDFGMHKCRKFGASRHASSSLLACYRRCAAQRGLMHLRSSSQVALRCIDGAALPRDQS